MGRDNEPGITVNRQPEPLLVSLASYKRQHLIALNHRTEVFFRQYQGGDLLGSIFVLFIDIFLQPTLGNLRGTRIPRQGESFRAQAIHKAVCLVIDSVVTRGFFYKVATTILEAIVLLVIVSNAIFNNIN
jgi:hypothetical protein